MNVDFQRIVDDLTDEQRSEILGLAKAKLSALEHAKAVDQLNATLDRHHLLGGRRRRLAKAVNIDQHIKDARRGKSLRATAHFLAWLYDHHTHHALPFVGSELDPNGRSVVMEGADAAKDNALASMIERGASSDWAELCRNDTISLLGVGVPNTLELPVNSRVQVKINPPLDGYLSIFNIDEAATFTEIYWLDPLAGRKPIEVFKGEETVFPQPDRSIRVGGIANTRSVLVVCISAFSAFDMWSNAAPSGAAMKLTDDMIDSFARRALATHPRVSAVCSLPYTVPTK